MKPLLKPFLLSAMLMIGTPIVAQNYEIQGVASLEILPGYQTKRGTQMAAVRISLKKGWKTYWRSPGGNGIPPQFQWNGSKNLQGVAFHWPAPSVYVQDGITTIGYKNELVLPIELMPKDKNAGFTVAGRVDFGICSDVCIPASAKFSATIAKGETGNQQAVRAALAAKPVSARKGGVASAKCTVKPTRDGFSVSTVVTMKSSVAPATLLIIEYPNPEVWTDRRETTVQGRELRSSADLYAFSDAPLSMDRSQLRLTVMGGKETVEIRGCAS